MNPNFCLYPRDGFLTTLKPTRSSKSCRNTDDGKRFALVNFKQPEAAKAAVEALHKKDMRSELEMLSLSGGAIPQ